MAVGRAGDWTIQGPGAKFFARIEPVLMHPATMSERYPVTPDGRYFVVRGRLWRCANPALPIFRTVTDAPS